jgi:hypothetical protein
MTHVRTHEDCVLFVKAPKEYAPIPALPTLPVNHIAVSAEEVKNYLKELTVAKEKEDENEEEKEEEDDDMTGDDEENNKSCSRRVHMINGVYQRPLLSGYGCDYCGAHIGEPYYYCWDCHKDMCHLCQKERSEEDAKANGAQNYQLRKEALQLCQTRHRLVERPVPRDGSYGCDGGLSAECKSKDGQILAESRYTDGKDYDLCVACAKTTKGAEIVQTRSLTLSTIQWPCAVAEFGSLLDWVPVIRDSKYNDMVLYCANTENPHSGKWALMAEDDHERCGYYITPPNTSISNIVDALVAIANDPNRNKNLDLSHSPIKSLMHRHNMQTHYG